MVIILLLIIPFLLLYLLIFAPIDLIKYLVNKRRFKKTLKIIPNLGYIVGVGGAIGAGKSTSVAGITTYMESYIMSEAYAKLDYVQTIINNYDFTNLNKLLDKLFFDEKIEKTMQSVVVPNMHNYLFIEDPINKNYIYDKIYSDGIKRKSYKSLLMDYIEAYLAIRRNNYVWSNIKFDSVITGNRAFELKGSDFKIKERYTFEDYTLRRYSIFNYDEATLDSDKINLNWQKMDHDSGTIEHSRLFRHYYKGTSYYYTTLQNPERLVKAERELFNSILMIRDKSDYEQFKRLKNLLYVFNIVNEFWHSTKIKIKKVFNIKVNESKKSLYRNIKRMILVANDRLNAKDYLIYRINVCNTAKEAEQSSSNTYNTTFVLPKKWCYGPIDTYEYSYQYDSAVAISKKHPTEKRGDYSIEDKIQLANEFLKKVEKKESTVASKIKKKKIVIGGI